MAKTLQALDNQIQRCEERLKKNTVEREKLTAKLRRLGESRGKLATNELARVLNENDMTVDDILSLIKKEKGATSETSTESGNES